MILSIGLLVLSLNQGVGGIAVVREGSVKLGVDQVGGFGQRHFAKLCHDFDGPFLRRSPILLGMNGLEHRGHLPHFIARYMAEDIAEEVYGTAQRCQSASE